MTSSEYRNTIMWTLSTQTPDGEDILTTARRIFNNLGVAFPQGTLQEVLNVLGTGDYMGWTECSAEQARYCANNGYTAMGIKGNNMVIILPDSDKIIVETTVTTVSNPVARELSAITEAELFNMRFFAYAALLNPEPVQISSSESESAVSVMSVASASYTCTGCDSCEGCENCITCQTCDSCQGCEVACEWACQDECESSCQYGCEVSCQTCDSCESSCEITCQYGCQVSCQDSCEAYCQTCDSCQSVCQNACQDSCEASCQTLCQTISQTCQSICQDVCQDSCEASCQTLCQTISQTCQSVCQDVCQDSCEASCQTLCQSCQSTCEDICQTSCQSSCQILLQGGSTTVITPIYPSIRLVSPSSDRTEQIGDNYTIQIEAEGENCSNIKVYVNGTWVHTASGNSLSYAYPVNSTGKYKIHVVGTSSTGHTAVSEAITVTVATKTYTVSYNLNGGMGKTPEPQTVPIGEDVTLAVIPHPKDCYKLDHTFDGWCISPTKSDSLFIQGEETEFNTNVTLYAQFTYVVD